MKVPKIVKDGPAVIDNMVGKFQSIVEGLDKGVEMCEQKHKTNTQAIQRLGNENGFLSKKMEQARVFRDNLHAMMVQPRPEAPSRINIQEIDEDPVLGDPKPFDETDSEEK
jgi:hypothetical protein